MGTGVVTHAVLSVPKLLVLTRTHRTAVARRANKASTNNLGTDSTACVTTPVPTIYTIIAFAETMSNNGMQLRKWKHKKSEVTRFLSSECLRGRKLFPSNWGQFMFFGKIYVLGF